jgi:chorismate mutase
MYQLSQARRLPATALRIAWMMLGISSFVAYLKADEPPLSQAIDRIVAEDYRGPEVPQTSDTEFQRRVYLDLIGRGPRPEETRAFLSQIASDPLGASSARLTLIDNLLASDEFSRYYSKVIEVMFTERREVVSTLELREFIRRWIDQDKPFNELCMEVIGGDGAGEQLRAAGSFFINRNADPNLVARDVSRIFLGRDVRCAQCHDHPLIDDYDQAEYFGVLSFVNRSYLFNDEARNNTPFVGERAEGDLEFTSVFRPQDGKSSAQPVLPMSIAMDVEPDFIDSDDAYVVPPSKQQRGIPRYSRRQQLAVLATHRENESFNRNIANRLWANMLGQGIVHPVDMHHSDNPPVSAKLLRLLSDHLMRSNYDLKAFLRQIARSQTYQRSSQIEDLSDWQIPSDIDSKLEAELAALSESLVNIPPQLSQLENELDSAKKRWMQSQTDVANLQQKVVEAKELFKEFQERLTAESKSLEELKAKQSNPGSEPKPSLEEELEELQEQVQKSQRRCDDQRTRILALVNRRIALGEFVAEARGVERGVRRRIQALVDLQSDAQQKERHIRILKNYLVGRAELAAADLQSPTIEDRRRELEILEAELMESWRRSFALCRLRALSAEQFTGATYYAMELYRPIEQKARDQWASNHQANSALRDDVKQRQQFINAAVSGNMWDTVEDLIVPRFSFSPGAPQDGFFATVDQSLMIQNDANYQAWLKSTPGNLVERLMGIDNPSSLAEELYLSILGRLPDEQESDMARELLSSHSDQRPAIVQELVWGLLASSEFRFLP